MSKVLNYVVPFLALPGLAAAQSSLGMNLGLIEIESSKDVISAEATVDVLFTEYHGFQGDLGLVRYDGASIGHVAGHLYLTTSPDQKYGLFASYHDWDDASISAYTLGAEGLFGFGEATAIGFQAGLGKMDPSEIDFIFAGVNLVQEFSNDFRLTASAMITDIDEANFSTTAHSVEIALEYQVSGPADLTAGLRHTRLSGSVSDQKTEVFAGLNIILGRNTSTVRNTPFQSPQPLRAYWQRGLATR